MQKLYAKDPISLYISHRGSTDMKPRLLSIIFELNVAALFQSMPIHA